MKHTPKQSNKAKKNLITWNDYKQIDFYLGEDDLWYLNCKDNVGISAFDLYKTIIQELEYDR